jgi:hypothetical protein
VCHEASEGLQGCTEDGRRPPGADFQEYASNRPELLSPKGVVGVIAPKLFRIITISVYDWSAAHGKDKRTSPEVQGMAT